MLAREPWRDYLSKVPYSSLLRLFSAIYGYGSVNSASLFADNFMDYGIVDSRLDSSVKAQARLRIRHAKRSRLSPREFERAACLGVNITNETEG